MPALASIEGITLKSLIITPAAIALFLIGCGQKTPPVYEPSQDQIFLGSVMYSQENCKNCHGNAWDGKGPDAESLGVPVPNFTSAVGPEKTPTSYFKAITVGTDKVKNHAYQSLTDKGRWALAHFLYSLKKPLAGEKADVQRKNIEAGMTEARDAYAKTRRWNMGFQPLDQREKAPDLAELVKIADLKPEGGPGAVSDERKARPHNGEGASLYKNNCESCHGIYGEGRNLTFGMGLIASKNDFYGFKKTRATISTRDLASSGSTSAGGLKSAHGSGSLLLNNFDSFTDAQWSALSDFIRGMAQ